LRFCAALCAMLAVQKMKVVLAVLVQRATSTSHGIISKGKEDLQCGRYRQGKSQLVI
jgi:hypothetical protein